MKLNHPELNFNQTKEAIKEKSKLIGQVLQEAGQDLDFSKVKCIEGADTNAKLEKLKALQEEIRSYNADAVTYGEVETARKAADAAANYEGDIPKSAPGDTVVDTKTIGELFMKSPSAKSPNVRTLLDIDPKKYLLDGGRKADFFTTSGWAPENIRRPGYVAAPGMPINVIDNLPIYPTTQNSVVYMLETTRTSAAAEKAEGAAAAESALALTETSEAVQEVATFLPLSKVQLEDVPLVSAYLTNTLSFFVRSKASYQILNGSGTPPALKGTKNIGGSLQTQAKGTDPTCDAIYKLFTKIRTVGYTEPSVIFAHPNDWQEVRLLRTADGLYIFGNPNDPGLNQIWGVKLVQTAECVENTMVAGDYINFAYVAMRRGIEVEMSSGYSDYFVKGKLAVLASLRCAVVHTRTSAFGTVTGV